MCCVFVVVCVVCVCLREATALAVSHKAPTPPAKSIFPEIGPRGLTSQGASVLLYDQTSQEDKERGNLMCNVNGEESYVRTAWLQLKVDDSVLLTKKSSQTRLSDIISSNVTIRTFQHSTYSCIRVDIPEGLHIPVSGRIKVRGSFGEESFTGFDMMGYNHEQGKADRFEVVGSYDLATYRGPQIMVVATSVQTEEALHHSDYDFEDIVSEPAAKLTVDPEDGNLQQLLEAGKVVTHAIELLIPSNNFEMWVPPQVKDRSYNTIRLYIPARVNHLDLKYWNVSWAVAGREEFSMPLPATPGTELLADGLHPDTLYQFVCCPIFTQPRDEDCTNLQIRTTSHTGKEVVGYHSSGIPHTHPLLPNGVAVVIPEYRSRNSPRTAFVALVFTDLFTGKVLAKMKFNETGSHVVATFDSSNGYRVVMSVLDDSGKTFRYEESSKNQPRTAEPVKQIDAGDPELYRSSPSSLIISVPNRLAKKSPVTVLSTEVRIFDAVSKELVLQQAFDSKGVKYLTNIREGAWVVRVIVIDSVQDQTTFSFVFNAVYTSDIGDPLFGTPKVSVLDSGEVSVNVPPRPAPDAEPVVGAELEIRDALSGDLLYSRALSGADTVKISGMPTNTSLVVSISVAYANRSVETFETLIRRSESSQALLLPPTPGMPRPVSFTESSAIFAIPAVISSKTPNDVMESRVELFDALNSKPLGSVMQPGSGMLVAGNSAPSLPYYARVSVGHGMPRGKFRQDKYFFTSTPFGLPPFDPSGPAQSWILCDVEAIPVTNTFGIRSTVRMTSRTTQRVVVRIPPKPAQLASVDSKLMRVDILVFGWPILPDVVVNGTGLGPQKLLYRVMDVTVGADTVIKGLPDPSKYKLDVVVKLWTEFSLMTKPTLMSELLTERERRQELHLPESTMFTYTPIVTKIPDTQTLVQTELEQYGFGLTYDADGSVVVVLNGTKMAPNQLKDHEIAKQFPYAAPRKLPGVPDASGILVVPVEGGVVIRTTTRYCDKCAMLDSVLVQVTTGVEGLEGQCKGAPIGAGEWTLAPKTDLFVPSAVGSTMDICATVFEGKLRWRISWNVPPTRAQTAPIMPLRGLPSILPFDDSRIIIRVPKFFSRTVQGVPTPDDDMVVDQTQSPVSMHHMVLMAFEQSTGMEFTVERARITITRTDTGAIVLTRQMTSAGDSVVSLPPEASVSRVPLDVRFDIFGFKGDEETKQNMSAIHHTKILNHIPETSEIPAPLASSGIASVVCRIPEKSLILRVPQNTMRGNAIVSANYVVLPPTDNSTLLVEGNATIGADLIIRLSQVRAGASFVVWLNTTDKARNRDRMFVSVTCSDGAFGPLTATGMPTILKTRDGFVNVRVPPKLLPDASPVNTVRGEVTKCGTNDLIWSFNSVQGGGDFTMPSELHHPPVCYNLTTNVTLATSDTKNNQIVLNSVVPIANGQLLPNLPSHGEVEIVPISGGTFVIRVPLFPAGYNEKTAKRKLLSYVTLQVQETAEFHVLLKQSVYRGGDTVLNIPACFEDDCLFSIDHQQIDEDGDVASAIKTTVNVVSAILTSIPDPRDPDVWTPTSDSIMIQNPLDQPLHYKVAELFTGRVITDSHVSKRGTFEVKDLVPATRYVITTEFSKNGTSYSVPIVLMTPLANAVLNETFVEPFELHVTAGSNSVLIQCPELTDDLATRYVSVVATDSNNTIYRAELKNPTRGETLLLEDLRPLTNYTLQITTSNGVGTSETTTTKIRTTRSTKLWGYTHTVMNKQPTSFDIYPAQPMPPGIVYMHCGVEDTIEKLPKLVYSGPAVSKPFTIGTLTPGRRFRVGWSLRNEQASYYDLCAFISSDAAVGNDKKTKPFVLRVTSDQVYIILPQIPSLDMYTIKSVEANQKNREIQRVVLYEGLGMDFDVGIDSSGWGPIKVYIARMLAGNTKYKFEVQPHYEDGSTGTAFLLEAITDSTFIPCVIGRPLQPAAPVVTPGTNKNRKFQLLWNYQTKNEGSDPNAYPTKSYALEMRVLGYQRQFAATSLWEFAGRDIPFTNNEYWVTPTIPGYEYEFRLTAFNFWGQSNVGMPAQVIVPSEPPEAVAGFTISNATLGNFTTTWDEPYHNGEPILDYSVECKPPPNSNPAVYPSDQRPETSTFAVIYTGKVRQSNVTGLLPATNYTCRVTARNKVGKSVVVPFLSIATGWTRTTVPEQVTTVTAVVIGKRYITVGFSKPRHNGLPLQGFDVMMRRPGKEGFELVCDDITSLFCNVTTLLPGDTYTFKVVAANCMGQGPISAEYSFRTLSDIPDPSVDMVLKAFTQSALHLKWTPGRENGETISKYALECDNGATCLTPANWKRTMAVPCVHSGLVMLPTGADKDAEINDPKFREVYKGDAPETYLQKLVPATSYRCRTTSLNAIGWSVASNMSVFRTEDSAPDAPYNLTITLGTRNLLENTFPVLVSWLQPAPNGKAILYYEAEMKNVSRTVSGSGLPVVDRFVGVSPTAFQWTSLTSASNQLKLSMLDLGRLTIDRTFRFHVRAVNEIGQSEWAQIDIVVPAGKPEIPGAVVAKGKTGKTLDVQCPLLDDGGNVVTQYVVEVASGVPSRHVDNPDTAAFGNFQVAYTGNADRVLLQNLDEGTDYKIRCKVTNAFGTSGYSSPAMFSTLSGPPDQPGISTADVSKPPTTSKLSFVYSLPDDNGQRIIRCDFEIGGSWAWDHEPFSVKGEPYETKMVVQEGYSFPYAAKYSITVDQLLPARPFSLRIRCWNSFGSSTWSDSVRQNTLGTIPSKPTAPTMIGSSQPAPALSGEYVSRVNVNINTGASNANGNAITTKKTLLSCVQGLCAVLQATNCNGGTDTLRNCKVPKVWELCVTTCSTSGAGVDPCDTCSIQNLLPASVYSVRNMAQNTMGWSEEGSGFQLTTPNTAPTRVQTLSVAFTSPTGATVSIGQSIDGGMAVTRHVIRVSCTNTGLPECAVATITSPIVSGTTVTYPRTITIPDLTPGQAYTFNVAAVNEVGESASVAITGTSPAGKPNAPSRPRLSSSGLVLSWDVPNLNGAATATYEIQASPLLQNQFSSFPLTSTSTTSKTFTSSQFDSTKLWQFRVRAVNSGGLCTSTAASCGAGAWSDLSNAYRMGGVTQCPIDPAYSSATACSGHGTCDQSTFTCSCEGNYFGNACQYKTTVGICQNALGTWSPFGYPSGFSFNSQAGEYLVFTDSLIGAEKVHAVLGAFTPGGMGITAITQIAMAFEGQTLSIELSQSNATACPVLRHNCKTVSYDFGTYTALDKTDQSGKSLGSFKFDGSCASPTYTLTNSVTGTKVLCNRFSITDGPNHPKFFQTCAVTASRRLCDSTCDPFTTETGLCGREGQSLADTKITDLTLSKIPTSGSLLTSGDGAYCTSQLASFTQLDESGTFDPTSVGDNDNDAADANAHAEEDDGMIEFVQVELGFPAHSIVHTSFENVPQQQSLFPQQQQFLKRKEEGGATEDSVASVQATTITSKLNHHSAHHYHNNNNNNMAHSSVDTVSNNVPPLVLSASSSSAATAAAAATTSTTEPTAIATENNSDVPDGVVSTHVTSIKSKMHRKTPPPDKPNGKENDLVISREVSATDSTPDRDQQQHTQVTTTKVIVSTPVEGSSPYDAIRNPKPVLATQLESSQPVPVVAIAEMGIPITADLFASRTMPEVLSEASMLVQTSHPSTPSNDHLSISSILKEFQHQQQQQQQHQEEGPRTPESNPDSHVTRLDLIRSQQMSLQVANALAPVQDINDAALVSLVGSEVQGLMVVQCPKECSSQACGYALSSCSGIQACKASCVANLCNSDCSAATPCAFDWVHLAMRCDEQSAASVVTAQTYLAQQITAAHTFEASLASTGAPALNECPQFVSSSEIWNLAPYDRTVAVWTADIIRQLLKGSA